MLSEPLLGPAMVMVRLFVDPLDIATNLFPAFGAAWNVELDMLKLPDEALLLPRDIFVLMVMLERGTLVTADGRAEFICEILFWTGTLIPWTLVVNPKNEVLADAACINVLVKLNILIIGQLIPLNIIKFGVYNIENIYIKQRNA